MATGGGGQSARSLFERRLPAEQRVRAARHARSGCASRPPGAELGRRRRPMYSMLITAGRVANADGADGRVKWSGSRRLRRRAA